VRYCPVCGEQMSLFDRTHIGEKHPEYFDEVRKWQFRFYLSFASVGLFLMLGTLYPDELVRVLSSMGTLIASGSGFFSALKWHSAGKKSKSPQLEKETFKREV
jgi:hypothetical protein